MKTKTAAFTLLSLLLITTAGCGGAVCWSSKVVPPRGLIFTHYSAPITVDPGGCPVGEKVGSASTLYVRDPLLTGIDLAWEDASIETAAAEGGLTEIYYADYEVQQILGVFGKFTTKVYGR